MINRINSGTDRNSTDSHVQKILAWRESLSVMQDSNFFELIRMYLGEIKTPYNKQNLIEELSSFLRKEENQRTLVNLLSDTDLQIISAVHFVPGTTQEKLSAFFEGVLSFAALYDRLLNLEERLILFCHKNSANGKNVIDVNPLLEKALSPFFSIESVLPKPVYSERIEENFRTLSPLLFSSFLAFVNTNPDVCKLDGSFKKRASENLSTIFPGCQRMLTFLVRSCINLSLIKESEKGFAVDFDRCNNFAQLSWLNQLAYLCAASPAHLSRTELKKQAQFLLNVCNAIPKEGYTEEVLVRSGLFAAANVQKETETSASRFSQILNRSAAQAAENQSENLTINPMERLVEPAAEFGLLAIAGKTEDNKEIFIKNPIFEDSSAKSAELQKVLSIDAGFSATILPGLSVKNLLPLIRFMEIKRCDSVATFEITRKSVLNSLDSGYSIEKILNSLTENSSYEIPQNLKVCLDEWNSAFSSASLYSGFVLKVNSENQLLTEKNPNLKAHIKTVLAPGVFLLDVNTSLEAAQLMEKCGIDFIGRIKNKAENTASLPFQALNIQPSETENQMQQPLKNTANFERGTEADRASFFIQMRKKLDSMNLSAEQKEGLELRIRRKIILNPVQLRSNSVRVEKNEAYGMDFIGKIRIVERAMATKSMIEIAMNQKPVAGIHDAIPPRILGTPLGIEKKENDSFVKIRIEPTQEEAVFSIGQAEFIKRLRTSFLEEVQ